MRRARNNWKVHLSKIGGKISHEQATFRNLISQKWLKISISLFPHMKIILAFWNFIKNKVFTAGKVFAFSDAFRFFRKMASFGIWETGDQII